MVAISIMSGKMAALGLPKINILLNKVYDIIFYVHDITSQVLSRDSNCIIDAVM